MKKSDEIGISREIGSSSKKSRNHQGNHEIWKSCTLNWPVSDPSISLLKCLPLCTFAVRLLSDSQNDAKHLAIKKKKEDQVRLTIHTTFVFHRCCK